jgi:hypothetical protein
MLNHDYLDMLFNNLFVVMAETVQSYRKASCSLYRPLLSAVTSVKEARQMKEIKNQLTG